MATRSGEGDVFVDGIFDKIDTDGSQMIEFSEFITAGLDRSLINSNQNLESIFGLLSDDNGFMTIDALEKEIISLRQKGQPLGSEECKFEEAEEA